MNDKFILKNIEKIRKLIPMERYSAIGQVFRQLTKYGIVIENKLLILLCSELTDVFRNSIADYNSVKKDVDKEMINELILSVNNLLDFLTIGTENLTSEDKLKIFDLLLNIIPISETIQTLIDEFFIAKGLRKTIRREII